MNCIYAKSLLQRILLVLFGGVVALAGAELALRATAAVYSSWKSIGTGRQAPFTLETKQSDRGGTIRILCLGESTTHLGFAHSYPATLESQLRQEFPSMDIRVLNGGASGTDTEEIVAALAHNIRLYRPHIIVTMMGINDSWKLSNALPGWMELLRRGSEYSRLAKFLFYSAVNLREQKRLRLHMDEFSRQLARADLSRMAALIDSGSAVDRIDLGTAYYQLLDHEAAIPHFQAAMSRASPAEKRRIYPLLLHSYLDRGDIDSFRNTAVAYAREVEGTAKTDEFAFNFVRIFDQTHSMYAEHVSEFLERALTLKLSRNTENLVRRALLTIYSTYVEHRDFTKATGHFRALQALGETTYRVYFQYASVANWFGHYEKVHELCLRDMDMLVADPHPWETKGAVWQECLFAADSANRPDLAAQIEKRALSENPRYSFVRRQNDAKGAKVPRLSDPYGRLGFTHAVDDHSRPIFDDPWTRYNYRKAAEIIRQHGIVHVAMQYPNREIEPLRQVLAGVPGVIFVENRKNFRDLLARHKRREVFTDMFAGDFGHFTPLGSAAIGKNVIAHLKEQGILEKIAKAATVGRSRNR